MSTNPSSSPFEGGGPVDSFESMVAWLGTVGNGGPGVAPAKPSRPTIARAPAAHRDALNEDEGRAGRSLSATSTEPGRVAVDAVPLEVLDLAADAGYVISFEETDPKRITVARVRPPAALEGIEPLLQVVLSRCHEKLIGELSTIWLKLCDISQVADTTRAIRTLKGKGLGLFVSCAELTSHDPLKSLDLRLVDAVDGAARLESIWHPLSHEVVPARPGRIYGW